ncbi:MAG: helix-turn-helix transcriptional regulator [Sulfuriferula sp.]
MAFILLDNPYMEIDQIIAENLRDLMKESENLNTLKKLSAKSKVGFGTVRRTRNGDGNITVQNLEKIAHAFEKTAVYLLTKQSNNLYKQPEDQQPSARFTLHQNSPDEADLLRGYQAASAEVRQIMLNAARSSLQKKPKAADQ